MLKEKLESIKVKMDTKDDDWEDVKSEDNEKVAKTVEIN